MRGVGRDYASGGGGGGVTSAQGELRGRLSPAMVPRRVDLCPLVLAGERGARSDS